MSSPQVPVPAHVPAHLIHDFDFYNIPDAGDDVQAAWHKLHAQAPDIFWTPRNGGHWIATRAEDIDVMQVDHERFSHAKFMLPHIDLPFPAIPLCLDPPEHGPFRALLTPALSPRAVQKLSEIARGVAIELIDGLKPKGSCEFVGDFAKVLPIVVFLGIVDLPAEDRHQLLPHADVIVRSADMQERLEANKAISAYLMQWIQKRSQEPGDDLISKIATAKVNGRPLTPPEVFGMCSLMLVGGLDTVAGMLAFTARYLAEHPEQRKELIDNPELLPVAIEEIMRRSALPNTARVITHDFEYKGIQFKQGDMIQLPKALYNLDERKISCPLTVDFHRPQPIPNATFGAGPHKCPGGPLARNEIRIFIEEWLKRIPDFRIKTGFEVQTSGGMVNGLHALELEWDV
ncbi:MAG: cytochrome P450 [Pseudoxanthomonas sp.]